VNRALEITPNNPELFYLKGQIQVKKGNSLKNMELLQQAESNFQTALAQANEQFPETLRRQLQRERDRNVRKMQELASAIR
ncbi:MAG: Sll0314/Alr1548 family TPR repeat-containing protein, partial [Chroococcales cyanobacterium]